MLEMQGRARGQHALASMPEESCQCQTIDKRQNDKVDHKEGR